MKKTIWSLLSCCGGFLSGCGLGTATVLDQGSQGSTGQVPIVTDVQSGNGKLSPVSISFRLSHALSNPASVQIDYLPPGGGAYVPMSLVGNPSLTDLATSPGGVVHSFDWDFASQLPSGVGYQAGLTARVEVVGSNQASSAPFSVGNDLPVVLEVKIPAGVQGDLVPLDLTVGDSSSDPLVVTVEYEIVGSGGGWKLASGLGPNPFGVPSTPAGIQSAFIWSADADEPGQQFDARVRVTASDPLGSGVPLTTSVFEIDNNDSPVVLVDGSGFVAGPDLRRGIPLALAVVDEESDPVHIALQWRRPSEAFPTLPDDPAALDGILADPALREQYRIATQIPRQFGGDLGAAGPSSVRLEQLGKECASLMGIGLVGRTMRILRPAEAWEDLVPSWSSNPLQAPVEILPIAGGEEAIALCGAGGPTWSLKRIQLATGVVTSALVTSSTGIPQALTLDPGGTEAWVVSRGATNWSLDAVELSSGSTSTIATIEEGATTDPVRSILALTETSVLLTAGSSLVRVDFDDPGAVVATALLDTLQTPMGMVRDPRRPRHVFVAERDWVDPGSGNPDGRVIDVHLDLLSVTPVATGGMALRPQALAVSPDGRRLLALIDSDPLDGERELLTANLIGSLPGATHLSLQGLPDNEHRVAAGPDRLAMVVLSDGSAAYAAGGCEQIRGVVDFDPTSMTAVLDQPLAPVPSTPRLWRIAVELDSVQGSPQGTPALAIWDSTDLPDGGDVVLRAVPYDEEQGLATTTGVPRPVRAPLDVSAAMIGDAASTDGVEDVSAADMDDDGDLDLVTANSSADRVTIFLQQDGGGFAATPDATLQGNLLTPMLDPASVAVADLDANGTLDVVTANRGSDNASVFLQIAGSYLGPQTLSGVTNPEHVTLADLDADGLVDVLVSSPGDDRVAVYLPLAAGVFLPAPTTSLQDVAVVGPVAAATSDLDGDGDLDVAVVAAGSENVALFFQTSPGTFALGAGGLLGGAGVLSAPSALACADLDGDGRPDVAVAEEGANRIAVFLQTPLGGWSSVPDVTLFDSFGPTQPKEIAAADLDGDGFLDLLTTNATNDLSAFHFDGVGGTWSARGMHLDGGGSLSSPAGLRVADVDADGATDLLVACPGADQVAWFRPVGSGLFEPSVPDLVLGGPQTTPGASAVVWGDLDADGDLDLGIADPGNDTVTIFHQLAPAVFSTTPDLTLGPAPQTTGLGGLLTAELDGDGRLDLCLVATSAGSLALFRTAGTGELATTPDAVLGGPGMPPVHAAAGDLDGDGDLDLVSACATADRLCVFVQGPGGSFSGTPDAILGTSAELPGPAHVVVADLDGDGDNDIAAASPAADHVALYLQSAGGIFATLADRIVGGAPDTGGVVCLATGDLDGDGDQDVVTANPLPDSVTVFLQSSPGQFPASPDVTLTDGALVDPSSLAVGDVDLDGDLDLLVGGAGSDGLVLFRQTRSGEFAPAGETHGGSGATDSPASVGIVDLDEDGDADLIAAHPLLHRITAFFGSH